MMRRHAELLCQHMGEERGCKEFRKHVSWYLKGFAAGGELRHTLALVVSLAALDDAARRGWTRTSRSRSPSSARRAAARAAPRQGGPARRAGSTTPTAPAARSRRTCTPAADRDRRCRGAGMSLPRGQCGGMRPSVIAFDVNETLSDLSPLGARFVEVGCLRERRAAVVRLACCATGSR